MHPIIVSYYSTPIGELIIGSYGGKLCLCDWQYRVKRDAIDSRIQKKLNSHYQSGTSPIIEQTIEQLSEYFLKERTLFDIPLLTIGTEFQTKVWNALLKIPYGQTETYLGLSKRLSNPLAIRAVASANGANAISIIIPCHRIIGANKTLVGYAGGIEAKQYLLELESDQTKQLKLF